MVADLSVSLLHSRSNSNRLNTKNVDWSRFRELLDDSLSTCSWAADGSRVPAVVYAEFLALTTGLLEWCGAYRPSPLPGRRKVQPVWWNSECDDAIARRRVALRRYTTCQTREERVRCRRVDSEVKKFLRRQKHLSFVAFCESIDPSVGLTRIWRTVRSLSSQASGGRTDRCSDPDSPAMQALREELVCPGIAPVSVSMLLDVDETDPMNGSFSALEFSTALESCNVRSAPGLDGIGYGVPRGMSERARGFVFSLFSRMFVESRFPHSWRDTLVTYLPKPGSAKFRPISLTSTLCKTFERMLQKRLEFLMERDRCIPANQFGFRRGRSSMDCVGSVVADVLQGFGRAKSTLALALDLKGAFNAVLPGVVLRQLSELDVPGRIINFVNFLTTKRMLHFSHEDTSPRLCGVGVPQGGVLSPILFSIHLRRVNKILLAEVRAAMYADHLLLYFRHSDRQQALLHLERAMGSLAPWLRSLGLSISIPKCQMCLFTRARRDFSGVVLEADGVRLHCCDTLKYLGVVRDARVTWLQHVKYVASRALRAVGLLRVLSRVSWGVTPSLLLLVYRGCVFFRVGRG